MCKTCLLEEMPNYRFKSRQKQRESNPYQVDNDHIAGAFVDIDIMDALIEFFGPIDEGFDNEQIDPSFWERWW